MFYSPSRRGFFDPAICSAPKDAVKVSAERHAELLNLQAEGFEIQPGDDGAPIPVKPVAPPTSDAQARADRNLRLDASDWTQLPDVPKATRTLWAPYRQALRDVPAQIGFPVEIDWPVAPTHREV